MLTSSQKIKARAKKNKTRQLPRSSRKKRTEYPNISSSSISKGKGDVPSVGYATDGTAAIAQIGGASLTESTMTAWE